ncbi:GNAT family N-acetyltransferase [Maribacter luteus]|uniref:GNAT family N-acetyltransferase n=1 Tax=Maribacter luteus TaxID=2594478 RepID=UPI002491D935|nr:GNAT family N-acetyltransferase [Maribacter luteus]
MMATLKTREMQSSDWNAVAKIYAEGIATGYATFEKNIPTYESWNNAHLPMCRLVAVKNSNVMGWAALSPVSSRCVYGGVAEVSIYVSEKYKGHGVGSMLINKLISQSEDKGFWTLQSGIFPENESSIALHKKAGFRYIGRRENVGQLNGIWKDNLLFERRSKSVGI